MARPGIEPKTADSRAKCPTDCATRPGPINYDKTNSVKIGTRQNLGNVDKLNTHIDDNTLKVVSSQKLPEIIIDENLLFPLCYERDFMRSFA